MSRKPRTRLHFPRMKARSYQRIRRAAKAEWDRWFADIRDLASRAEEDGPRSVP